MGVPHPHATPTALLKPAAQCPGPESMQCPPSTSQLANAAHKGDALLTIWLWTLRTTAFLGTMDMNKRQFLTPSKTGPYQEK